MGVDKGVNNVPKGISLKMNAVAQIEFEFAYYNVEVNILATMP